MNISSIIASINPCKGIIKTNIAPHNRTLRTSFDWKLKDAFAFFFGVPCKARAGIFDLFTLGIPLIIHQAWCWCFKKENPLWIKYILGFLVGLINVPLLIARGAIAVVCAFNPISLIITLVVHLISQYIAGGEALKKEAFNLTLKDVNDQEFYLKDELANPTYPDNDKISWALWMSHSPENLRIQISSLNENQPALTVRQVFVSAESCMVAKRRIKFGEKYCYLPFFKGGKLIEHGENLKALKALIKLNVGDVTTELENTQEGVALLNDIMAVPDVLPLSVN